MGPQSKHRNLDLEASGRAGDPQEPRDTATVAAEPRRQAFHTEAVGGILASRSACNLGGNSWGGESPAMEATSIPFHFNSRQLGSCLLEVLDFSQMVVQFTSPKFLQ